MKYCDIESIWTVDLDALSKADCGRVYFERAKQIIEEVLADPKARTMAINGNRIRRKYLVLRIGCGPAVTTQNPKIVELLAATDAQLSLELGCDSPTWRTLECQSHEVTELKATIAVLRRRLHSTTAEGVALRRLLRRRRTPVLSYSA
uniref:Uncharacterized protein n=1 Tax=Rhodopseudomonas palustris (strain BisA53) TaxID=316055 RepID=Q07PM9_RHOP5